MFGNERVELDLTCFILCEDEIKGTRFIYINQLNFNIFMYLKGSKKMNL